MATTAPTRTSFGTVTSGPAVSVGPEDVIVVDHLTKRFGPVLAVDDLSFRLESGTVTGFLGPNGAGKTTTLRMLLGLVRPTAGRALLFGPRTARTRIRRDASARCSRRRTSTPAARDGSI